MRTLPPAFAEGLNSGATTLSWCWRLTRRDGHVQGFTEHDADLTFDGTTFEAQAGMQASEMRSSIGLSVDDLEVESALSSGALEDGALDAGLYDDAKIEIFRVDWTAPENRVLMRVGTLGEVRRAGQLFTAEVRGLAHYLQQAQGRLFQHTCDAELGDHRCGVDLSAGGRQWTSTLATVTAPSHCVVAGTSTAVAGFFSRGLVEVLSGSTAGWRGEIKRHQIAGTEHRLELWRPFPDGIAAGAAVRVTAGCDKHLATCRDRFANAPNFRGFPYMPGNDFISSFARAGAIARSGSRA
jgi:uncharacterized phage protein (TIGR02218 family)